MSLSTLATKHKTPGTKSVPVSKALRIGDPNDTFEREANRVADQVMSVCGPKPEWSLSKMDIGNPLQRTCGGGGSCEGGECKQEKMLQREAAGPAQTSAVAPPIVHEVLRSPGQPLDSATRAFMEPRFGHDFGAVKIHTGNRVAESARDLNALAYTIGSNVFFGADQHNVRTRGGLHLMAHELAHVVQQGSTSQLAGGFRRSINPGTETNVETGGTLGRSETGAENTPLSLRKNASMIQRQEHLPAPNRPLTCEATCDANHNLCVRETNQACEKGEDKVALQAGQLAANNVAKVIDSLTANALSTASLQALKANFNWSSGNAPANLPTTVTSTFRAVLAKMGEGFCFKCADLPAGNPIRVAQAQGKNCRGFNCFMIDRKEFASFANPLAHGLLHEVLHRVLPEKTPEIYRGLNGGFSHWPPQYLLEYPDPYASLADDLVAAGSSTPPAPTPGTPPAPAPAPPSPRTSPSANP